MRIGRAPPREKKWQAKNEKGRKGMEKEIWAGFLVDLTQDRFSNISNFPSAVFNHIENIFARTILKII